MEFSTIFFDLDDTLYPAESGLWPALKERMTRYMVERVGIPAADVPRLREAYFRKYGTTLRGLQANHKLDVDDYLAYVHDVQLDDYIHPNPEQQAALAVLRTRNLVFTNADARHARRVLRTLGIEEYFVDVVDINRMEPHCKPSTEAFALAMRAAGETHPSRCVMIDDLPHTTRAARSFGLYTVLAGATRSSPDADAVFSEWTALPKLFNGTNK